MKKNRGYGGSFMKSHLSDNVNAAVEDGATRLMSRRVIKRD
jgi:hypothetical protein